MPATRDRASRRPRSSRTVNQSASARAFAGVDWRGLAQSWTVRLLSLAAGVLLWHLACSYKFNFFINFENVPAPLVVLQRLHQAHL